MTLADEKFWTYEDYRELPDDGKRYEVIGGKLYVSPSPSIRHQTLSRRVQFLFYQGERAGQGYIFNAPADLRLETADPVQPDLIYLRADQRAQIKKNFLVGPPALIVEIQSPSPARLDRVNKLHAYAAAGVPQYWLLDPGSATLEVLKLDGESYRVLAALGPGDVYEPAEFPGIRMAIDELFCDLPGDEAEEGSSRRTTRRRRWGERRSSPQHVSIEKAHGNFSRLSPPSWRAGAARS